MPDLDLQNAWPFTAFGLTQAMNIIPNNYGLINALNLFPSEGLDSTIVEIRRNKDTLSVLEQKERGSTNFQDRGRDDVIFLNIPHMPADDTLTAKDVQNMVAAVNRTLQPATLEQQVTRRLEPLRRKHAITREYMRMGALKGLVVDGGGNTIHDLFNVFGVTKLTVDFLLGTAGTDIIAKCTEVTGTIEDNLNGDTANGAMALVNPLFFDKLIQHPNVSEFYKYQQGQQIANPVKSGVLGLTGREFLLQNMMFKEYRAHAPLADGTTVKFIDDNKGHAFPLGTGDSFFTYDAPPDHINFVNQPGMEVFVSQAFLDHGKGIELHTESNPLPICRRPGLLVELTTSN
jgi:Phage major capsid protein E